MKINNIEIADYLIMFILTIITTILGLIFCGEVAIWIMIIGSIISYEIFEKAGKK